MKTLLTRRQFLGTSALAVAGFQLLKHPASARSLRANEKLNVAVIGCSGRGGANLAGVAQAGENIVALCDVDMNNADLAAQKHPQARKFQDFRKMFDAMARGIDAVVVSTPDHTHAVAGLMALKLGKHLYCEKPLAHSVFEVRALEEAARKKRLCTQMGTQIHAGDNYRRVVELVQSGAIGPVKEVHVWHPANNSGGDRPPETPPVPPNLDWDLWLGPAPVRPYHPCYVPKNWRGWWDFANGGLGDFFCHYVDLVFWALELRHPASIEADGPPVHPESCPAWIIARYAFPARKKLPPIRLTWFGGTASQKSPLAAEAGLDKWSAGVLFIGDKGMLAADYNRHKLLPEADFADFSPPQKTIPDSLGHHEEWIVGCKTGGPTTCNFDYSGPLAEAALLANVAYRSGEKIVWDARKLKALTTAKAAPFLRREYRKGWRL